MVSLAEGAGVAGTLGSVDGELVGDNVSFADGATVAMVPVPVGDIVGDCVEPNGQTSPIGGSKVV